MFHLVGYNDIIQLPCYEEMIHHHDHHGHHGHHDYHDHHDLDHFDFKLVYF